MRLLRRQIILTAVDVLQHMIFSFVTLIDGFRHALDDDELTLTELIG